MLEKKLMEKELVFKTTYTSIFVLPHNNVIEQHWENSCGKMTDDCFKKEMMFFLDFFMRYQYPKFYVDARKMNFLIDINIQEWVDENITPGFMHVVDKAAFMLPSNIFEQLSVKQTVEETSGNRKKTSYFDDINEAYQWLLN